ncbi:MAG: hypothetical protein GWP08_11190 [Nitrospiraceae bacterium]|nr:hypothetical protein [Nitrospiraceae bacterium]
MKNVMPLLAAFACLALPALGASDTGAPEAEFKLETKMDRVSYSVGNQVGDSLTKAGFEVDFDTFMRGVRDVIEGKEPLMSPSEVRTTMQEYTRERAAKRREERRKQSEENIAAQEAFLKDNAGRPGVVVLPSGLQYKVIEEGTGASPKATDRVKVHYRGTLLDGTEFDSSYKRSKPSEFMANGVIQGWSEALQLMREGAKWELYIPSELAYGPRGSQGKIGPNAMLVFEVELLEILPGVTVVPPINPKGDTAGAS